MAEPKSQRYLGFGVVVTLLSVSQARIQASPKVVSARVGLADPDPT